MMNETQQQAVIRLGNRLYRDAVGAAQAAEDGISGRLAEAAYHQLAGVYETLSAAGQAATQAARHIGGLIQKLNRMNGNEAET